MTHAQLHVRVAKAFGVMYGAWTFASLLAIAIRAPTLSPWQNRNGSHDLFIRWTVVEAIGCILDLAAVGFSTYLVWSLQMPTKRKMSVAGIFATRLLIWPLVALRLWKLYPSMSSPATPSIIAEVLTEVVMEMALNLASITCVKPFLKPFQDGGYVLGSSKEGPLNYGITGASRTRSESYLMLGTAGSTVKNKNGSIVHASMAREREEEPRTMSRAKLRTDVGHNEAACERDNRGYSNAQPKAIRVSRTVQIQRDGGM